MTLIRILTITIDIYEREGVTFAVNLKMDSFILYWDKWVKSVQPEGRAQNPHLKKMLYLFILFQLFFFL